MILINAMNILRMIKAAAVFFFQTPILLIKFFYLRRIGIKAFEHELLIAGMDSRQVAVLILSYKNRVPLKWKYFVHRHGKRVRPRGFK